jgi:hypothetical protein
VLCRAKSGSRTSPLISWNPVLDNFRIAGSYPETRWRKTNIDSWRDFAARRETHQRDTIFTAILDSLARKPGADIALKTLQGKLGELFGLNAVGAQQAEECLRRWLSSRNLAA